MVLQTMNPTEVVVAGGGPAGMIAAIAAARTGAKTLLVEQGGSVGGLAVVELPLLSFHNNREERIVEGIPLQLIERLEEMNAAAEVRNTAVGPPRGRGSLKYNARAIRCDPEALKYAALEMLHEAGGELLLHTYASDVVMAGEAVAGLVVENKSGRVVIPAERIVDCTGDGDVAARAGAPFEKGRPDDGSMQPMTPFFLLSNVDAERAMEAGAVVKRPWEVVDSEVWQERCRTYSVRLESWKEEMRRDIPEYADLLTGFGAADQNGDGVWFCGNMIHIPAMDATDGQELSRAEFQGQRLVWRMVQFLRRRVPGFEGCHLVMTFPQIGVRESRRIRGEYRLTYDDVVEGRRFDDVVALCGYRVDIHGYDGGPVYNEPERGTQVKDYGSYDIPYGCLVPQRVENLLVAGRCISGTHEAHASYRVMGTCMATGHAAGTAAALSTGEGVSPRGLDMELLQQTLLAQGAYLGERFAS
ncbi:MAG: FAD-dependent oxidoreductase [Chloroflexota bacterium]